MESDLNLSFHQLRSVSSRVSVLDGEPIVATVTATGDVWLLNREKTTIIAKDELEVAIVDYLATLEKEYVEVVKFLQDRGEDYPATATIAQALNLVTKVIESKIFTGKVIE